MFIIAGENPQHLALNENKAEQFKISYKSMQQTACPRQSMINIINNKILRYNVNVYFYILINLKDVSIPL